MGLHFIRAGLLLAAMLFSGAAMAHPGHGNGIMAGALHPLLGLDHLLAMMAVGMWAAQLGGRARWLVPASFLAFMALAASLAMAGMAVPQVEGGIAASVLLAGLLIAFSVKVKPAAGAVMVAAFAFFHGYAHGVELPALVAPWRYGIGFLTATALLHGVGMLAGGKLQQARWVLPATGSAIAACGGWMLATLA